MNITDVILQLKIGLIKDLYKNQFITQIQMEQAINLLCREAKK